MNDKRTQFFYGWYVAIGCTLIYFFTNAMTLFVPQTLFPRLMEEFGLNEAEISLTVTITLLFAALFAPFAGMLIDRFGPLKIMRIGIVLMAVTYSLYSFSDSVSDLYRLHFLLAIGLVLSGLVVNIIIVSNWFVKHRGKVIGMLIASSSLGGATLPLLISPIVNDPDLGWRWGFGLLSILFWLFAVVPAYTFIKEKPSSLGLLPDGLPTTLEPSNDGVDSVSLLTALKSRTLWCLGIGSACLWFSIQGLNSQITIFFEQEAAFSPQQAVFLFSTLFWFSFIGKFAFGAISDTIPKRTVLLMTSIILFLGTLLLFDYDPNQITLTKNSTKLSLFTVIFGLGFGGSFSMIQLVAVEIFGPAYLGRILGIITFIDGMGAALGTNLLSQIKTNTGSYLLPFLIVTIVSLIAIINVLMIKPIQKNNS
jgi:MFS family permease